jgi:FkbM family methyltransferase
MQTRKKKFIEIGTCDFRTLRHLCDQGWEGVMVDPHAPFLNNISDHENLTKVSVAVGPESKTTKYYKIKDSFLKDSELDYRGMGSIYPKTPLLFDEYKGKIESNDVQVITFDDLISVSGIGTEIDYLKVDAEGMDLDIIQSIDLQKYNIKVILMEIRWFWKEHAKDYLEQNGYLVQILHNDLFAIKLNLLED